MSAAENKKHIIAFAIITALCLIGDSMLYIVLPVHYQDMGLSSLWEVGVILAVNRIVRLPLNPCIGWFYSHVSERTGILIAVSLATATTLSYGFLPSFAFWILARCVWGVAWTLLRLGSLFCILKLSTPENRGHFTGLYNGLYRLGSLVGMFLGGILADLAGVRSTAIIFGVATAVSFVMALIAIPRGDARERDAGTGIMESLGMLAQNRKTLWVVAGGGLVALVVQGVLASTLSRLISVHTDSGLLVFGTLIGASTLAGFFQALRWGWEPWLAPFVGKMSDQRFGRTQVLYWAFGAGACFLLLLGLPLPLSPWFICLLGMQVTATVLTTISDAAASDAAAGAGGRALLMGYALIVDVGAAVGPLVAYGMNEFLGINSVYIFCAFLFLMLFGKWRLFSKTW